MSGVIVLSGCKHCRHKDSDHTEEVGGERIFILPQCESIAPVKERTINIGKQKTLRIQNKMRKQKKDRHEYRTYVHLHDYINYYNVTSHQSIPVPH